MVLSHYIVLKLKQVAAFYMFPEMVKEIRDAAQIRETVLVAKVEALVEKCTNVKNMVRISIVLSIVIMRSHFQFIMYQARV